jgi:phospholipid/cholesterol/gamma-HCH transport system ATP-binding protein
MLFQGSALFDSLSVLENVMYPLEMFAKTTKEEMVERARFCLQHVDLKEQAYSLAPSEISGGMQKRVSLARAIATNPEIIFFDEPTTGLDPIMADVINNLIIANSKELGATTITITHDMHSARKIADKIAMLYEGKIIWCDSIKNLDNSHNPFVDQFINGRAEGPIDFLKK